jgi:hypothetical protein
MLINAYVTTRDLPALSFPHTLRGRRDRSDAELAEHLDGFTGYVFSRPPEGMTADKYHLCSHIKRVRHHLSLEVAEADFESLAQWGWSANAILFVPDGTIRDPAGAVLLDPEGRPRDPDARVPFPEDAEARKRVIEKRLASGSILFAKGLPPVVAESEVLLRSSAEVAQRALALFVVAVRAESLARGPALDVEEIRKRLPLAFPALSPDERAFLDEASPDAQRIANFGWRYEALFLLLWALGKASDLPWPTAICDVPWTAGQITRTDNAAFVANAQLRPAPEILDALDLHLRLHWAVREERRKGEPPPASLEPGVIQERHYALNWLTGFEDASWDDVDTPT